MNFISSPNQDDGRRGLSLRGTAVTTETATTAETAKTVFCTLSFLSLFICGKSQGKPPKKQGFLIPTEPLKSLEKKGRRSKKKTRKFLAGERKTRNSTNKKNKERGRTVFRVGQAIRGQGALQNCQNRQNRHQNPS